MSTPLSQEQKKRIEENRKKAMEIRAVKMREDSRPTTVSLSTFYRQPPTSLSSSQSVNSNSARRDPFKNAQQKVNPTRSQDASSKNGWHGTLKNADANQPKTGHLTLISRDRFELVIDYHQPTIDAVKAIPERAYDSQKRHWNFPLTQYETVLAALKKLQPSVVIGELPKLIVDTFVRKKYSWSSDEVDLSRIQMSMRSTLMDFQVESVKFAVSREGRVLIADDMGLGKTIQALAISDYYRREWPLLIVCPSSMRFQWAAEIRKHLVNVNPDSIFVIMNGKDVLNSHLDVVITSYDLMTTFKEQLLSKKFGVVIMDESHNLKNPKAIRTKTATAVLMKCKRCILLSGTPVLSRPVELHCQLQCIKPQIFNKFMEFAIRYCDAKKNKFGWDFTGFSNMTELSILLKELLMIRRLKSDVLSQLPPKTREVVIIESSGKNLSDTSEFAKILDSEGLKGLQKHSTLVSYFQETANVKIKGVTQYIQDMIERGEKFLVFAHHVAMMDAICTAVESKRTDYIRIDGSVSSITRKQLCSHFQEEESCLVGVLSIKSANTGLTLTAANLVIFAELFWNPGDLIQAEDRAHRIGQQDSVLVQYIVQRGTADDKIWPLIKTKLDVLQEAGLSQDAFNIQNTNKQLRSQEEGKKERNIADYFLDDDDMALAEIDLDALESFETPEKKPRLE